MNKNSINRLLFVSILVMAVLPLAASVYFVDNALETSLNLGFNSQISEVLDDHAANLKMLAHLDAPNQDRYRQQFEQTQNLRTVYESGEFVRKTLHHSLLIYFSLGLVIALMLSVATATILGRRISNSYRRAFDELSLEREKVRYLEGVSTWQELAKILAHEIKNPLTPIELLVTSLEKFHREQSPEQFSEQLSRTRHVILEELNHLNETVRKFSAFSILPSVQTTEVDLWAVLVQQINAIKPSFPAACITLVEAPENILARVELDTTLFRQVLTNIIRNGLEANPDRLLIFILRLKIHQDVVQLMITNDGVPVTPGLVPRMFDPYVSSRASTENMGLGLAIVKKILLEHGGDIAYEEQQSCPVFIISLPRLRKA